MPFSVPLTDIHSSPVPSGSVHAHPFKIRPVSGLLLLSSDFPGPQALFFMPTKESFLYRPQHVATISAKESGLVMQLAA